LSTLKDDLLPIVESIRGIPGDIGLRVFTVAAIRIVQWSGTRVGLGNSSYSEVPIAVASGKYAPKIRQLSQEDIVRSGGDLDSVQYEIGPVTPSFIGGGYSLAVLDPVSVNPSEVFFRIVGPGTAAGGDWFVRTSAKRDKPFRYMLTVKKTAAHP
jgi:hypothetical protein